MLKQVRKTVTRYGGALMVAAGAASASAQVVYPIADTDVSAAQIIVAAVGGVIATAWGIGFLRRNMGRAG
jgi:fructose-1,6-bisphosphatase/inositol monophosphatase family enzyme